VHLLQKPEQVWLPFADAIFRAARER